jgi:hypothetical protein
MTKSQRLALEAIAAGGYVWSSMDYAFLYDPRGLGARMRRGTLDAIVRRGWVSETQRKGVGMNARVRYDATAEGKAALLSGGSER